MFQKILSKILAWSFGYSPWRKSECELGDRREQWCWAAKSASSWKRWYARAVCRPGWYDGRGLCCTRPTAKDALRLIESRGLKWYRSSPEARRGSCGECGGILFWERADRDTVSNTAGALDPPTGLSTAFQIHVASVSDYYLVDPRIPQRQE